jgi:hypothetical protein
MTTQRANKKRSFVKLVSWFAAIGVVITGGILMSQPPTQAADVVVYKSPSCGCCAKWIDHLEQNGFNVEVHNQRDMGPVKDRFGVPRNLQSCHTAQVDGYVVEGHVPAEDIERLLKERPDVKGLAVPGMPMGSPGMEGPRKDPYDVLAFSDKARPSVFSSR